ncbi:MAG TPA: response regulator, partial [Gammaproteobacteria bacterium]|nr:response regulator [Gammaproteobacteria bacterium]
RNVEALLGQSGNVAAMAGPAMRGQRLLELAQARDCAWLKDGGAGALPPGAPPQPGSAPPLPGAVPRGLSLPPQPGSAPPP